MGCTPHKLFNSEYLPGKWSYYNWGSETRPHLSPQFSHLCLPIQVCLNPFSSICLSPHVRFVRSQTYRYLVATIGGVFSLTLTTDNKVVLNCSDSDLFDDRSVAAFRSLQPATQPYRLCSVIHIPQQSTVHNSRSSSTNEIHPSPPCPHGGRYHCRSSEESYSFRHRAFDQPGSRYSTRIRAIADLQVRDTVPPPAINISSWMLTHLQRALRERDIPPKR